MPLTPTTITMPNQFYEKVGKTKIDVTIFCLIDRNKGLHRIGVACIYIANFLWITCFGYDLQSVGRPLSLSLPFDLHHLDRAGDERCLRA